MTLCRFVALRNPLHRRVSSCTCSWSFALHAPCRAAAAGAAEADARALSSFSASWQRSVLGARPLNRAALAPSPTSLSRRALTSAPYAYSGARRTPGGCFVRSHCCLSGC